MTKVFRWFVAIIAFVAAAGSASAGVCRYNNMMPAFLAFEQQTKGMLPDRRAQLFVSSFVPQHREFYGEVGRVIGVSGPSLSIRLRKDSLGLLDPAHMETLPGFAPLSQDRFEAIAAHTGSDFDAAQAIFTRAFPDFRCEADIDFGPSFLHFDGHVYEGREGRQHLLFGVDAISLLHSPADMPIVYVHELFHIYHRQVQGAAYPNGNTGVWWPMWEEGLATYVSQRLTSAKSPQQVLFFPSDIVARMQAPGATRRAARLMLADFDKHDSLLFDSANAESGLPARAGYYMGYQFAASLARGHSFKWLAHLPSAQVKREARKFLESAAG